MVLRSGRPWLTSLQGQPDLTHRFGFTLEADSVGTWKNLAASILSCTRTGTSVESLRRGNVGSRRAAFLAVRATLAVTGVCLEKGNLILRSY